MLSACLHLQVQAAEAALQSKQAMAPSTARFEECLDWYENMQADTNAMLYSIVVQVDDEHCPL